MLSMLCTIMCYSNSIFCPWDFKQMFKHHYIDICTDSIFKGFSILKIILKYNICNLILISHNYTFSVFLFKLVKYLFMLQQGLGQVILEELSNFMNLRFCAFNFCQFQYRLSEEWLSTKFQKVILSLLSVLKIIQNSDSQHCTYLEKYY